MSFLGSLSRLTSQTLRRSPHPQCHRQVFIHHNLARGSPFLRPRRCLSTESTSGQPKSTLDRVAAANKARSEANASKNRNLLMYSTAVIVFAMGASYAAVPLYRMFCAATGFAGTPNVGTGRFEPERLVPVENATRIKVHFNADRSEQLPWTFTPQQKFVTVLPGETSLAFYTAKNNSDRDIIGIANNL